MTHTDDSPQPEPNGDAFAANEGALRDAGAADESALRDALSRWRAPEPPAGFGNRVLADLAVTRRGDDCAPFLRSLEAWRAGDLAAGAAATCAAHAESCSACAEEIEVAREVDRLLATFRAPPVPSGFSARVFASLDPGRRRLRVLPLVSAAAALAAAALLFVNVAPDPRGEGTTPPAIVRTAPPTPFDRIDADRDRKLRTVLWSGRPDATGSFATKSARLESLSRPGGNLLHVGLRRSKSQSDGGIGAGDRAR